MKKLLAFVFLLIITGILTILPIYGQNPPPHANPPQNRVPIDGGASLLAAAGVAYGVKKYRDYRKGNREENE